MTIGPVDPQRDGPTIRATGPSPARGTPLKIKVRRVGEVNVVHMAGRMTLGEGNIALRETMTHLLESDEKRFVFDMLDVPVLDSASVGEIVACRKRVTSGGGALKLVAGGKVLETFRVTRLDRILDVHEQVDDALSGFSS